MISFFTGAEKVTGSTQEAADYFETRSVQSFFRQTATTAIAALSDGSGCDRTS
jgi:hypothetical protein